MTWLLSAPPTPGRLFLPHNEHVIPIARLLYWLQYRLQGANGSVLFWVSLSSQLMVVGVFWREIASRWPAAPAWRHRATGGALLALCSAWQLHSIVLGASVLFPMVLLFSVLAIWTAVHVRSRADGADTAWGAAGLAASLGAMLTTTNGIAVPVIVASVLWLQGASRRLAFVHATLAVIGLSVYVALVPGTRDLAAGGTGLASQLSVVVAYFFALFGSFVTYLSPSLGVTTGAVLAAAGLVASTSVLPRWSQAPRAERFAIGVMAFAGVSALMAAVGRAQHFGIEYAAQSRYGTYAMAYWAALLVVLLSTAERGELPKLHGIMGPAGRALAIPACLALLVVQTISGIIWMAKADNVGAAGVAVAAGVHDDQWVRTLHGAVDVVYRARALAVADGDRTIASQDLGRRIDDAPAATECAGSLSAAPAPEGSALRIEGILSTEARSGWVLDANGIVVGVAGRAPLVNQPDPTGADVLGALRRAIQEGSLSSNRRWLGFAPASVRSPLAFVAVASGRVACRKPL